MKQQKKLHKSLDNKGYSLVEMIIVIAIIVLLTALAGVTVTMLSSARAKEAAVTFDSEVAEAITKSKTQLAKVVETAGSPAVSQPTYGRCIKLYKDGTRYYMKKGFYDPSKTAPDCYVFDADDTSLGAGLSSRVQIGYQDATGTEKKIGEGSNEVAEVYICFDRMGRCVSGDGTYLFYKKNGNQVASVAVNKNGSRISK